MLLALLPVRNGSDELDGWFASVRCAVDGVLALDDGSTDDTLARLRSEPLVQAVLERPVRPDVAGWDDRANRQALLDLAVDHGADWVLWLDADERLPGADADRLRRFVADQADRDAAYGFALYDRVAPDGVVPEAKWVYRLHAVEAGDVFPGARLHFPPIPIRVPRRRWLRTSLRIEHLGMATPARRRARYDKYGLADPDRRWQASYEHLLVEPVETTPLPPPLASTVVLPVHVAGDDRPVPDLSVVVIAHHDRDHIDAVVDSVLAQEVDGEVEVIAVVSGDDGTAPRLRARGDVVVVDLGATVTPGVARTAAREVVTGDFVVFVGSHVRLEPGSLAARLAAHRDGWAMVSGPVRDGSIDPVGRAAFVLDHAASSTGRAAGELAAAPARCSYVRFALDRVGWFPDVRAGEDTEVNLTLFDRGFSAWFEPGAAERYVPAVADMASLRAKHRHRGVALRRIRRARGAEIPRLGVGYAWRRTVRLVRAVWRHPDRRQLIVALPRAVTGVLAARSGYVT
ncbi:MAG: glycosyltransferase [Actinomycetota bacterium]